MSATWPNEPTGATTLLNHGFADFSPFFYGSAALDTDATAPVSPSAVMRSTIQAGSSQGGSQINWSPSGGQAYQDLFVGIAWRTNPQFQGRQVGNKMFFVRGPVANGVFLFNNAALTNGSGRMLWVFNSAGLDNSHITGTTDPGWPLYPNVGNGTLTVGTWYKIEAYLKKSTTNTSRDGIIKWWINEIPAGSYTNVNYAANGLNEWVWSETWDGTVNPPPSVAWSHYLDHLYISTGGTLAGGGTPPPGPEPPPPAPVTLQSLTPANLNTVVGTAKQFTISMSGAVQTATSLFTTSSNTSVATVPASVTIPQGASTVLVTATPVATGSTTISTSYNGVTKGATLQVGTAGGSSGSTVYDYATQFSGVQGQDGWYYLEDNGTQMTYNGAGVWVGTDSWGGLLQTIWSTGFHPGGQRASILRWVAPSSGDVTIVGAAYDLDTGGGISCSFRVNHNGVTLFTRIINNGDTTGGDYNVSATVAAGDQIDFVLTSLGGFYHSTNLNPVITLSGTTTDPTPPPPPPPPTSVVDLFTTSTTVIVGFPFTMTVRVSAAVAVDTAVEIRVGSSSILTAPPSVTVLSGASTVDFTVTPIAASLVAIEAVLNGTKRVTLTVQAAPTPEPPPGPDPGPGTNPALPTNVSSIHAHRDGATVTLSQGAKELAFRYDAQPEWMSIGDYPATFVTYTHRFTWPSGTTMVCYRAKAMDDTWGASSCAELPPDIPPPVPPPAVIKSVTDKYGIRWQLSGKASPFILKRNGSSMDNTYGVTLRKSGDGYMEILQTNGVWLRRNGNAWEFVE